MRKKNLKLKTLLLFLISIVIIYCIVYFLPKNYKFEYQVDGFNVVEAYNKKDKLYTIKIEKKKNTFEFIGTNGHVSKRKLINKVEEYSNEDTTCIIVDSDIINHPISCIQEDELIDYHLTKDVLPKRYYKEENKKETTYKELTLNNLDNTTYYIWNYQGFYKVNKNEQKEIDVFETDTYDIKLATIIKDYLVVADYDQKYNFNKFKLINLKNNKVSEFKFKEDISFDSRILGVHKNNFYILDEKNEIEYEVNIKKKKITKVNGKLYQNGKWEKVNIHKIKTDNLKFENPKDYIYEIKDGLVMYQRGFKTPIKISDKEVKTIVYENNDTVYYIADDSLYKYNFEDGERKVLSYFELNFNYENMIIIYNSK